MKVVSPAGDFDITIQNSYVEGEFIVLKGQMGVWDSKIYLKPVDLLLFIKILMSPSILMFLVKLPFKLLSSSS